MRHRVRPRDLFDYKRRRARESRERIGHSRGKERVTWKLAEMEKYVLSTNSKNEVESKEANITKDKEEPNDTAEHKNENEDVKNTLTKDEETKVSEASDKYTLEMDLNKEELEQGETANEKYKDTDVKNKDSEAESKDEETEDLETKAKKVKGYYIPYRPVFKCESKTTPIRPVFDNASCRRHNGLSLNQYLEKGPNLLERIPEIRIGFRENKFGVLAYIRKYFQMIAIKENDRDYLRFIRRKRLEN
ncbi:hypothetical protein LAZ67_X002782 [Cordylochernes scorpioides]|uniref:Uncharacterized protein n=1 Tax=Cordylochernes scorpioides TaxID=51811 RepID=A0ABY6LVS6_9ARAC|nr:hypothetical protein LAZ67_X002782 [Cordylochernes scorpioides]